MPDRDDLDPSAEPTDEERAAAEELRRALDERAPHEDAELLRALANAHAPAELSKQENARLVAAALAKSDGARKGSAGRGGVVVRVSFGVAAALALAAGVAFFVGRTIAPGAPPAELAHVRSTQPLFDRPFKSGEGSARVDRIAMARASDLRENRFARWGVR